MELMKKLVKPTFYGPIPDDWIVCLFEDVIDGFSSGMTPYRGTPEFYKGNIPWIKSGELNYNIITDTHEKITRDAIIKTNLKVLPVGTFLMAITGLEAAGTRGSCGITGIKATTNQSCMALFPKEGKIDSKYLYHFYVQYGDELAFKFCQGTKQQSYTGRIVKILPINLPPTLTEQKVIATALSDVDALIFSLEQTITKKKAIKQGAMQQLLTPSNKGGKRLPGFEGEWVEKTLGEISHIKTGSKNNQDNVEDGEYPFYVRSQSVKRINTYSYDEEAILIPGEGGIGTIFHYINGKFEVHQRVYKISSFSERVLGKFIFLKMKHEFYEHAMINSVKATVDSLRLPTFQEFEIYLPSTLDEQKAIAQILSDMDAEITQLETKKEKYQAIKQGMMQELLTGKTRLV
jgi:type I restriction enzyme S subunit